MAIASGGCTPRSDEPEYEFSGSVQVDDRLHEDVPHHQRPECGTEPGQCECPQVVEERFAEVDDAGDAGYSEVEDDHQAGGGDRVVEDVAAHHRQGDVVDDRDHAVDDRGVPGCEMGRMDRREPLGSGAVRAHRKSRAGPGQDRRLRRRRRGREDRDDQELVEPVGHHVLPERVQHLVGVVFEELRPMHGNRRDSSRRCRCRVGAAC